MNAKPVPKAVPCRCCGLLGHPSSFVKHPNSGDMICGKCAARFMIEESQRRIREMNDKRNKIKRDKYWQEVNRAQKAKYNSNMYSYSHIHHCVKCGKIHTTLQAVETCKAFTKANNYIPPETPTRPSSYDEARKIFLKTGKIVDKDQMLGFVTIDNWGEFSAYEIPGLGPDVAPMSEQQIKKHNWVIVRKTLVTAVIMMAIIVLCHTVLG